jgi:4-hydroxy-tetrahydrodipicolinate synthase
MKLRMEGIWCPMATPLKKDGSVDSKTLGEYVDYLIDGGVEGLFPLGTTGEFALLSDKERSEVAQVVVDQTNGRVPVAIGVSDPCTERVLSFSKNAKDIGADAVVATPPYYYTVTEEAMYRFYKRVGSKIDLPLILYNIPAWTQNYVPPEIVKKLADEGLIVGMKYTEYNFLNLQKFISATRGKIAVFTGSDALTFSNLEFGGAGAVIGVSNVAPKQSAMIYDEFKKGNLKKASKIQSDLLPVIEAIGVGKYPAGLKEAMKYVGMPLGEVKEPLLPLDASDKLYVKASLKRANIATVSILGAK